MTPRGLPGHGILDQIERLGNRLPDPVMLFVWVLVFSWVISAILAPAQWAEVDPRTSQPIRVVNQLTAPAIVGFLARIVRTFMDFPPLGAVLVIVLATGVAESSGLFSAAIRALLRLTSRRVLTPMLLFVAVLSHSVGDPAYAIIIPAGAAMFAVSGRHPLLGIAVAFAGAAGGFSASFLPSSLDPLLQGFTQQAARIVDPDAQINPLCNWGFMSVAALFLIGVGWFVTDRIVEPRLAGVAVDGDQACDGLTQEVSATESRGLLMALVAVAAIVIAIVLGCWPADSALRAPGGNLFSPGAPLMQMVVPILFLLMLVPGIAYGCAAGTVRSHRDLISGMTKGITGISYYVVMAFFAAQFTAAFTQSNLGLLIAVKGANAIQAWQLAAPMTIGGIILLTAAINLLIGSASAKWALLSPIFVPMLMAVGLSPELTQAAFRVGDSSTNIVTPLMRVCDKSVTLRRR